MTFIYHILSIRSKTAGFTLIEIIAVLAIISVLSAISLPRFINVSSNAGNQALSAAVTELNSRECLMWAKIKISPSGWINDEAIFSFLDVTLGSDYKWSMSPTVDGGVLQFKDQTVDLQRDASTTFSAGNWQLISESDAINKDKKNKDKNKDNRNNGKKNKS
jgi:prepilin-type N-terminal cleavage/methylation domain-containing protein